MPAFGSSLSSRPSALPVPLESSRSPVRPSKLELFCSVFDPQPRPTASDVRTTQIAPAHAELKVQRVQRFDISPLPRARPDTNSLSSTTITGGALDATKVCLESRLRAVRRVECFAPPYPN